LRARLLLEESGSPEEAAADRGQGNPQGSEWPAAVGVVAEGIRPQAYAAADDQQAVAQKSSRPVEALRGPRYVGGTLRLRERGGGLRFAQRRFSCLRRTGCEHGVTRPIGGLLQVSLVDVSSDEVDAEPRAGDGRAAEADERIHRDGDSRDAVEPQTLLW